MARSLHPKSTPQEQLAAFQKAARELGTDDDPERFKERVKRVGASRPNPESVLPDRSPKVLSVENEHLDPLLPAPNAAARPRKPKI